jgi:hypothetical protein
MWDHDQGRDYADNLILNPTGYTGTRRSSQVYILNWVQQVFRTAETELSFDLNLSHQADREAYSNLDPEWELAHRDAPLGIELSPMKFLVDFDHYSDDDPNDPLSVTKLDTQEDWDQLVDNVRNRRGTRVPYEERNDLRLSQPYRNNPFAMTTQFPTEGRNDAGSRLNDEYRWLGRLNVDWQFDRYNRLKFGGEAQTGRLRTADNSLIRARTTNTYSETPQRWAAYVQDRLDLGDVVLELGIRWDYFDTRSTFPINYSVAWSQYDPDTPLEELTCRGDECDPNLHIWKESEPHSALSPRLRVSFPVTARTNFRFSYAHQVQSPAMWNVFRFKNSGWRLGGGDVTFGRSILFEFGLRHAFTRDLVLDLAAYNKEKVSDLASRLTEVADPSSEEPLLMDALTNADFGNVLGFELSLISRIGNWFNAQASYTFQTAKATGSDPYSRWYNPEFSEVTGELKPPPEALLRTDDNRTHSISGSLAFNFPQDFERGTWYGGVLRNAGMFWRFQFLSGLPYTRLINAGQGDFTSGGSRGWDRDRAADDEINGSTLPWQYWIDLRLTKGFRLGPTDLTLYADFRNLLNIRNVVSVFNETGSVANDRYRDKVVNGHLERLRNDAGDKRLLTIQEGGRSLDAIDLTDCAGVDPLGHGPWLGEGKAADCIMVRNAEARFGNGDMIYDEEEQLAALYAWYDLWIGEQWFLGDPRHIRLGVELRF